MTFSRSGRSSAPFRATCPACGSLLELAGGHLFLVAQGLSISDWSSLTDARAR